MIFIQHILTRQLDKLRLDQRLSSAFKLFPTHKANFFYRLWHVILRLLPLRDPAFQTRAMAAKYRARRKEFSQPLCMNTATNSFRRLWTACVSQREGASATTLSFIRGSCFLCLFDDCDESFDAAEGWEKGWCAHSVITLEKVRKNAAHAEKCFWGKSSAL